MKSLTISVTLLFAVSLTLGVISSVALAQEAYTGLIVDATGLGADTVLYPEILTIDEEGVKQPVYILLSADPMTAKSIGIVQYTDTLEEAKSAARVGSNPYIVRATEAVGTVTKGNFIIPLEEARKIRDANKISNFFNGCKVAIAIGEAGGEPRTAVDEMGKPLGGTAVEAHRYKTTDIVGGIDHFDYKRNVAIAYGQGTIPDNAPDPQTGRILAQEEARLVAEAGLIRLLKGVQISAETTSEIAEKHYVTRIIVEKLEGYLKGAVMTNLKYVTDAKTDELLYVLIEMEVPISSSINELLTPIHQERLYLIYEFANPNY